MLPPLNSTPSYGVNNIYESLMLQINLLMEDFANAYIAHNEELKIEKGEQIRELCKGCYGGLNILNHLRQKELNSIYDYYMNYLLYSPEEAAVESDYSFNLFTFLFSSMQELEEFIGIIEDPHPLILASCHFGYYLILEKCIEENPHLFMHEGPLYFSTLAAGGQLDCMLKLLDKYPWIPCTLGKEKEETPLHALCDLTEESLKDQELLWVDLVEWLIQRGCSITQETEEGKTPAHIALLRGNTKMLNQLVAHPSIEDKVRLLDALLITFRENQEKLEEIGINQLMVSLFIPYWEH